MTKKKTDKIKDIINLAVVNSKVVLLFIMYSEVVGKYIMITWLRNAPDTLCYKATVWLI